MNKIDMPTNITDLSVARDKKRKTLCPICKKPTLPFYFPFCSVACKEEDLGNWITGKYFIPDLEQTSFEEEDSAANDLYEDPEEPVS